MNFVELIFADRISKNHLNAYICIYIGDVCKYNLEKYENFIEEHAMEPML